MPSLPSSFLPPGILLAIYLIGYRCHYSTCFYYKTFLRRKPFIFIYTSPCFSFSPAKADSIIAVTNITLTVHLFFHKVIYRACCEVSYWLTWIASYGNTSFSLLVLHSICQLSPDRNHSLILQSLAT